MPVPEPAFANVRTKVWVNVNVIKGVPVVSAITEVLKAPAPKPLEPPPPPLVEPPAPPP